MSNIVVKKLICCTNENNNLASRFNSLISVANLLLLYYTRISLYLFGMR